MTSSATPRILAVLAVAIALAFCAGCATTPAPQGTVPLTTPPASGVPAAGATTPAGGWLLYTSPAYGYSLSYPASWTVREENGGATVTFTTPSEGPSDTFRENLRVEVRDLSANPLDLTTFVDSRMATKKAGLANYNPMMDGPTKIGTTNARKIVFQAVLGSDTMQWVDIYALKGLKAYSLDFSSQQSHYRFFVDDLDKTLKSFTFTS